ncbi:MAG TPA: hypothetical protein VFF69_11285 [Phycisphaerales bacterium]|nr:hypothetical protein [Phycisphaerales bacterium]
MKIILDDELMKESADTLAEAIRLGASRAASKGRVVVDILADGRAVGGPELGDSASMARGCEELRLTSAEPKAFVRVTLLDAADALGQARAAQQRAAELVEAGSLPEAYQTLAAALNLWQAARQALDEGAQLVGLDLSALPLENPDELPEAIAELSRCLEEVRRCVGAQDWAGLSDVLLYDLDRLVDTWRDVLRSVAGVVDVEGAR